ncbi:unnamed protein product [Polarella glacialis]|uniref:Uncharacterized protein n=1 Tax=Polarella glacialis TaxID=89957 RepID=A0A813ESR2_POLGL|nr:unnamed protein product [Polarella glacialis]
MFCGSCGITGDIVSATRREYLSRQHMLNSELVSCFLCSQVLENVIPLEELSAVRAELQNLCAEEGGRFEARANDRDFRQDQVCWLRESDGTQDASPPERGWEPLGPSLISCIGLLRGIPDALEKHGYVRSLEHRVSRQLQLAWYSGDGTSQYAWSLFSSLGCLAGCVSVTTVPGL